MSEGQCVLRQENLEPGTDEGQEPEEKGKKRGREKNIEKLAEDRSTW